MSKTLTAIAMTLWVMCAQVFAAVPGFQGTVNHYRVGMYDRTTGNYSQWMNVDFQAFNDGTVEAPIIIENDSLRGFCGQPFVAHLVPVKFPAAKHSAQISEPQIIGSGGERGRNRTFNLVIKSHLLCQLSYAPA
jgi:hypothetical protein